MKKINYVGSLTKDIETIQNKEQEESTIPLVIKVFAVTIFFLTAMSICLHQFSSALIVPVSSTLSALACAKSISASKFFARERAVLIKPICSIVPPNKKPRLLSGAVNPV